MSQISIKDSIDMIRFFHFQELGYSDRQIIVLYVHVHTVLPLGKRWENGSLMLTRSILPNSIVDSMKMS